MSFLEYEKETPDFLNNYLKYKAYIEFRSKITVNEMYYDLRTLFRYIKLSLYETDKIDNITPDEFKKIKILDVKVDDFSELTRHHIEKYILFLGNVLNNEPKTRNKKLASAKKFFEYLEINRFITTNPTRYISAGQVEKRIPKHLNLDESKQLLANIIKSDNKKYEKF